MPESSRIKTSDGPFPSFATAMVLLSLEISIAAILTFAMHFFSSGRELSEELPGAQRLLVMTISWLSVILVCAKKSTTRLRWKADRDLWPYLFLLAITVPTLMAQLRSIFWTFTQAQPPLLLCLKTVIIIPFLEELFFRGYVLNALLARFGTGRAITWTSILFAVIHIEGFHLFALYAVGEAFVFSLIVCSVAIRARSLFAAVFFHMTFNAMLAVFGSASQTFTNLHVLNPAGATDSSFLEIFFISIFFALFAGSRIWKEKKIWLAP